MPRLSVNGLSLHYEEAGKGPETVVFSHGLLWSGRMFEAQMRALSTEYRCIAFDHRGQGRSDVPGGRSISIEDCYLDAVALIESLKAARCHFVGLSMGGFVALRLALRRPDLVRSITLLESAADEEPVENRGKYRSMNLVARLGGISLVASRVMQIMFGDTFLSDPSRAADRERWIAELKSNKRTIYRAVNGVIERESVLGELGGIQVPAMVLHGKEDRAIHPHRAERTAKALPNARLHWIEGAGHSSSIEAPEQVTRALRDFFQSVP